MLLPSPARPRRSRFFRARCSRPRVRGPGTRPGCHAAPPDRLRELREYRRRLTFPPCFGHELPAAGKAIRGRQARDDSCLSRQLRKPDHVLVETKFIRGVSLRSSSHFYKYHSGGISLAGIGATRTARVVPWMSVTDTSTSAASRPWPKSRYRRAASSRSSSFADPSCSTSGPGWLGGGRGGV